MSKSNYIFCLIGLFISSIAFSQTLPVSRSTDWTNAGYPGNIPVYTSVRDITSYGGNGNGVALNDAALQNAIAGLNNQNGTIYFPPGTFIFNAPVLLRSGIVLKGAGAANSVLKFHLGGSSSLVNIGGTITMDTGNIISPLIKGSSSLTVTDASLFTTGDYIKLYDNDTALVNDNWAYQSTGQLLMIDSIQNNSIYFSNPLRRSYSLINQPRIRKLQMVTGCGIECLTIKRMDATAQQTANISFNNAADCWIKGIESDSCNFAHIQLANSSHIEITDNYFHGAFAYNEGGKGYGISCEYTSGDCLIENNIFRRLRHSMLVQSGANGNVFTYNYSTQPFKTEAAPFDFSGDIVLHGNYPYLNLFEGNIVQNIVVDASHDINGPFNTFFRNRAELYGIFITPGAGDSTNIIGNEITSTGFQQGNYVLYGDGNFEYGNNKNDTIIPAGSTMLTQKSFVYNATPGFWNSNSLWPSIGPDNIIRSGNIPAKERAVANTTYCLPQLPVIYTFTGNGNWSVASNWSNGVIPPLVLSPGSEIIIDPAAEGICILNIPYTINPGAALIVREGKRFEVGANLVFVK